MLKAPNRLLTRAAQKRDSVLPGSYRARPWGSGARPSFSILLDGRRRRTANPAARGSQSIARYKLIQ